MPDNLPGTSNSTVAELVARSNRLGADPRNTSSTGCPVTGSVSAPFAEVFPPA